MAGRGPRTTGPSMYMKKMHGKSRLRPARWPDHHSPGHTTPSLRIRKSGLHFMQITRRSRVNYILPVGEPPSTRTGASDPPPVQLSICSRRKMSAAACCSSSPRLGFRQSRAPFTTAQCSCPEAPSIGRRPLPRVGPPTLNPVHPLPFAPCYMLCTVSMRQPSWPMPHR